MDPPRKGGTAGRGALLDGTFRESAASRFSLAFRWSSRRWRDPKRSRWSTRSARSWRKPTPRSSPSTAGSPCPSWRRCARRSADRTPSTRSSRTRWRAGRSPTPASTASPSMFEGPVAIAFVRGDAASAAKALRDFGRNNPALVLKGGLLGQRVITAGRHRSARRAAVPRRPPRPGGGHVPGAAGEGRRPVPGVHAELRLRREGPDRPARRRPRSRSRGARRGTRRSRSTGRGPQAERRGRARSARKPTPPRPKPRRSRKRRPTPKLRHQTRPHQNPNRLSPSNRRTAIWPA